MQTLNRRDLLIIICIVGIVLGLMGQVYVLSGSVPFHDWDEAIYAQVAREFVRAPQFALTYNGAWWFEKPPLPTLLYAIAWILPLPPELVARMVSVAISALVLWLLYRIASHLKLQAGLILLVLFATVQSAMFRDRSVLINVDMLLIAGWLLYTLGYVKDSFALQCVGLITGTLSKSLLGLFPLITHIFVSLITGKANKHQFKQWIGMAGVGLFWHLMMTMRYGMSFIQSHFLDHLVARVVRPIELHFGGKWFYIDHLWSQMHVITIVALGGALFCLYAVGTTIARRQRCSSKDMHHLYLLCMPIAYLALLTIGRSKLHWYTAPLIPFVALWAGIGLQYVRLKLTRRVSMIAWMGCVIAMVGYSVYLFIYSLGYIQPDWFTPTEKTIIGQCIRSKVKANDGIVYVLPEQERTDAMVIEAAQLQIGSSFIYGSAPAFLYYADAPVRFVYRLEHLSAMADTATILVLDKDDAQDPAIRTILKDADANNMPQPICNTPHKLAYRLR